VHVEIKHIQNQLTSQRSGRRDTLSLNIHQAVWMEDFTYDPVHPSDEFVITLANEKGESFGSSSLRL
jgi:hypothetical protein